MPYSKEEIGGLMREARQLVIADLRSKKNYGQIGLDFTDELRQLEMDLIKWEGRRYLGEETAMKPDTTLLRQALDDLVRRTALAIAETKLKELFK